ncbi:MAG: flavodoxin family protein [Candidatus Bathyarchaeia archaeon]
MKILIVFESNYGNTKLVAEKIMEGAKEVGSVEVFQKELKEVDVDKIPEYDVILIGSPNHMGGPTRGIKGFIDKLGELGMEGKMFAVFDTYMGRDFEKALKKMEKRVKERNKGFKQIMPGLSIKVNGIKGPIMESEILKCKEFGRNIAIAVQPRRE